MRIAVCTKDDLFGAIVLNTLVPLLAGHDVALFMSVRERPAESLIPELDLMRLMERDLPCRVVFPLADARGAPRPGAMATPTQLAAGTGRPLTIVTDMQPGGGIRLLHEFAPDLILSIRFSFLFRRATIERTPAGILNVHPGPLPGYRGLYAPFWQMLRGSQVLRCTLHMVDPGVDTGPVLAMEEVPLSPGRSMLWHALQLYLAGARRAAAYAGQAAAGLPLHTTPQDAAGAHHNGFPSAEDFTRFRAAGHFLVTGEDYTACLLPFVQGSPERMA